MSWLSKGLHKLTHNLGSVVKKGMALYNSPLGQIGMSFVPGGSALGLLGKFGKFGKIGGKLAKIGMDFERKHPRITGLVNKVRHTRFKAPGRVGSNRPGGWARMANVMPANPFLNGRFAGTHNRKLLMLMRHHPGSGVYSPYRRGMKRRQPRGRRRAA